MALGKELGDFSFKITSVTHLDPGNIQVNLDGTAANFGTVLGTHSFEFEPGAQTGSVLLESQAYLPNGDQLYGSGQGTFESAGGHTWRIRTIIRVSDGQVLATDGVLDLATRSYSGKVLEWS